jgi:hypothetical protein
MTTTITITYNDDDDDDDSVRYFIYVLTQQPAVSMAIQSDSKLLPVFPWPIIFKPYVPRKARMLKLFSISQY